MSLPKGSSGNNSPTAFFHEIARLQTEERNPASMHIDEASPLEIARLMNAEDQKVATAVSEKLPAIAAGIEGIAEALKQGGRLFYAGAGTSGRLGVLDAAECPPTFGTPPELVQGLMAGGKQAVFRAQEGVEDRPEAGAEALREAGFAQKDVLCGLAASGRTPFVAGALAEARRLDATTLLVCCVEKSRLGNDMRAASRIIIDIPVGPEVVMGSTRLKSGTAQKMVCNMLSTGAMIRLGKVYENVMVDLQLSNRKLEERARRIIMMFAEISYEAAGSLLEQADHHVKTALVMAVSGASLPGAKAALNRHKGFIRPALRELSAR
ncbi:MAG: N-acetylmuramic acid 6-phosphate etherase [Cyclonatronaceae bacterium]